MLNAKTSIMRVCKVILVIANVKKSNTNAAAAREWTRPSSLLLGHYRLLMRDSGCPLSTTRVSAHSTSPRSGSLLIKLLLQRFLHTQTGQSTPVVFPAQTLRCSSQKWRFWECLPRILWLLFISVLRVLFSQF